MIQVSEQAGAALRSLLAAGEPGRAARILIDDYS
jgi:hypothetical protein